MADVKISDLTAATSANGAMQLEVNDGGTSKSVIVSQLVSPNWTQVGTTQSASGVNTVTFSSIGDYGELELLCDDVTVVDQSSDPAFVGIYLLVEWSIDGGSTYAGGPSYPFTLDASSSKSDTEFNSSAGAFVKNASSMPVTLFSRMAGNGVLALWPTNNTDQAVTFPQSYSRLIYTPNSITNIRVRSYWENDPAGLILNNMTGGTIKLYKR